MRRYLHEADYLHEVEAKVLHEEEYLHEAEYFSPLNCCMQGSTALLPATAGGMQEALSQKGRQRPSNDNIYLHHIFFFITNHYLIYILNKNLMDLISDFLIYHIPDLHTVISRGIFVSSLS